MTTTTVVTAAPLKHVYTPGQQSLVNAVTALGWALDPTATFSTYRGGWGRSRWADLTSQEQAAYLVQHPFTFTRPAAAGGRWQLELDYDNRGTTYSYAKFGKTLQAVKLRYFAADGTEQLIRWFGTSEYAHGGDNGNYPGNPRQNIGPAWLKNPGTSAYRSTNWLWEVTRDADGGHSLRRQAEKLATSPEAVLWLAAEAKFAEAERKQQAEDARKADAAARARELAPSWNSLRRAARDVLNADGKSDAAALLAALKAAVAVVEEEVVVR